MSSDSAGFAPPHNHRAKLEEKGYVHREPHKARSVGLTEKGRDAAGFQSIPIVGGIPAGVPVIAEEMYEGLLHVCRELGQSGDFALRVEGNSITGAGIFHGDYVIVRKQDYAEHGSVVVLISGSESEGSLKGFFLRGEDAVFAPANPGYEPIILPRDSDAWRIVSVVVAVVRVRAIRVSMPSALREPAS